VPQEINQVECSREPRGRQVDSDVTALGIHAMAHLPVSLHPKVRDHSPIGERTRLNRAGIIRFGRRACTSPDITVTIHQSDARIGATSEAGDIVKLQTGRPKV
jgi:hypothetical protein